MAANLSPQKMWEAIQLVEEHGSVSRASIESGIPRGTLVNRYQRAQQAVARGELTEDGVVPGFSLKSVTTDEDADGTVTRRHIKQVPSKDAAEDPEGLSIKGLSQYVDGQGNLIGEWRKWDKGKADPVQIAREIAEAFDGMKVKKPRIDTPAKSTKDLLTLYPMPDLHLGLLAWGAETGADFDLAIAGKTYRKTMSELVMRSPVSDTAVILGLGDLLHADNFENQTAKSKNALDVDGRYPKIIGEACSLMSDTVMMAMQKHKNIIVRILPGNHDQISSVAIAYFLSAFFKDEKRVTIDLDPAYHWVHSFGKCLLVASHGDMVKPARLQGFISSAYREQWGGADHVHAFVGHLHSVSKTADEFGGMTIEQLQAPVSSDAWHRASGYSSGRSLSTYCFHTRDGLFSSTRQTIKVLK